MNELRLAARDFVTDPGAPPDRVGEAASELSALLKKTRLELAPEQQDMIDGVTAAAAELSARHRTRHRSDLAPRGAARGAALGPRADSSRRWPPCRTAAPPDAVPRAERDCRRVACARSGERRATAERMRALSIDDPALRAAADAYADAIIAIAGTEGEIAKLDKEVLGTEGRLIGRVTELLRELSAQRGRMLSHDFARTLSETRWQSILLGTLGVLIGIFAAIVCGPPHGAAACRDRAVDPGAGGRQQGRRDSRTPTSTTRSAISRAPPKCSAAPWSEADAAREAAVRALGRTAARRGELSQAVRSLDRRHLCHDAGRRTAQRQSGAGADHGI